MADTQSEEFRKFILENRDIIEKILDEGKDEKSDSEFGKDKIKEDVKDLSDGIARILKDDDVQKHFISGCLEFLHFFEAVIEAAPLSPEAREAADNMKEAKDHAVKNVISVNVKDKVQNIKINDVKDSGKKKKADSE